MHFKYQNLFLFENFKKWAGSGQLCSRISRGDFRKSKIIAREAVCVAERQRDAYSL